MHLSFQPVSGSATNQWLIFFEKFIKQTTTTRNENVHAYVTNVVRIDHPQKAHRKKQEKDKLNTFMENDGFVMLINDKFIKKNHFLSIIVIIHDCGTLILYNSLHFYKQFLFLFLKIKSKNLSLHINSKCCIYIKKNSNHSNKLVLKICLSN